MDEANNWDRVRGRAGLVEKIGKALKLALKFEYS